jgi:hypothetical protein
VPQGYVPAEEAQGDGYEAEVKLARGRAVVQGFARRACLSGREFHMCPAAAASVVFRPGRGLGVLGRGMGPHP